MLTEPASPLTDRCTAVLADMRADSAGRGGRKRPSDRVLAALIRIMEALLRLIATFAAGRLPEVGRPSPAPRRATAGVGERDDAGEEAGGCSGARVAPRAPRSHARGRPVGCAAGAGAVDVRGAPANSTASGRGARERLARRRCTRRRRRFRAIHARFTIAREGADSAAGGGRNGAIFKKRALWGVDWRGHFVTD